MTTYDPTDLPAEPEQDTPEGTEPPAETGEGEGDTSDNEDE